MTPSFVRRIAFGMSLIGSFAMIRVEPLLSLLLIVLSPLTLCLSYRKSTTLLIVGGATSVSAWLLPGLISPKGFWALLAVGAALTVMLPSAVETMPLQNALRAVWKDLLLLTVLFSVWPNMLRLPEGMHWGVLLPTQPSIYFYWGVVVAYAGIRLWSMQVGIWGTPPNSDRSSHWQKLALGGRVVVGAIVPFLLIGPWMGETTRILILFAAIAWAIVRLLYYLRLAIPHRGRLLIDIPMIVPAVVGLVGVAALFFGSGSAGAELAGAEEVGPGGAGEGAPETAQEPMGGPTEATTAAATGENALGFGIGPLQEVDGYVRSDGTVVQSYVRTVPDETPLNNLQV